MSARANDFEPVEARIIGELISVNIGCLRPKTKSACVLNWVLNKRLIVGPIWLTTRAFNLSL